MKRTFLALLAALLMLPAAAWGDSSRSYEFRLTVDGDAEHRASAGDTVTVSLTLCRTSGTGPMYAMQDEIVFDPDFFAYQPDTILLRDGVKTSMATLRDGCQALYMNYVDFGQGADWADEVVIGSFQLKVLASSGTSALRNSNYLVPTKDGMDHYAATAQDAAVVVSESCRVTFQSNGGSAVEPQTVPRGALLKEPQPPVRAGCTFAGWYSDFDLTQPWDFGAPVTADMDLYAAWHAAGETVQKSIPSWPGAVAVLIAAAVLAYDNRRKTQ